MDRRSASSKFKVALQRNPILARPYAALKSRKDTESLRNNLRDRYVFDDRSQGSDIACIVLAGYKPYLYPYVLPRLYRFAPPQMDVCIVTAGKCVDALRDLCAYVGWSYVATHNNNVSLAQNVAINLHPAADLIFKLDEDIFVTEGFFGRMLSAREHALQGDYRPGPIAPILPVNGYGHLRVLERFGATEAYAERFERPLCVADPTRQIERNPEAAQFLWGEGGFVPHLDDLAQELGTLPREERPSAIRFSIGAILLERAIWEDMGYFDVYHGFVGLGLDERQLCTWCTINSRPIMVSENAVAGHFGFGQQTAGMREYLLRHPDMFDMSDTR